MVNDSIPFNSIVLATQGMTDSPSMLYHLFFGRVPKPRAAKERGRAAAFTVRFCLAASKVDGRKVEPDRAVNSDHHSTTRSLPGREG